MNPTATRPRGRPPIENPRDRAFLLRLNEIEEKKINGKAKKAGKVRADWIRETLLAA